MANTHAKVGYRKAFVVQFKHGYEDSRLGKPYRAEYAAWKEHQQGNYEIGRLAATHMAVAGVAPPMALCAPSAEWRAAYNLSGARQGNPLGWIRQADSAVPMSRLRYIGRRGIPAPVPV